MTNPTHRELMLLTKLARHTAPVLTGDVVASYDCDPSVACRILRGSVEKGHATCEQVKKMKLWQITEAGRAAINSARLA